MLKRLYKQPKKIGKEIDAILKQLSQIIDKKIKEESTVIKEEVEEKDEQTTGKSRVLTFFMS